MVNHRTKWAISRSFVKLPGVNQQETLWPIEVLLIRRLHLRHLLSGTVKLGPDVALAEPAMQP